MAAAGWWVASAALIVALVAVAVVPLRSRRTAATGAEIVGGLRAALDASSRQARALDAENDWLRTILAALDDAVIVVGPGQEILSVNDAAITLFPTSFATVRGRSVIELTGDHEIAALMRRCQRSGVRQERTIDHSGSGRSLRVIAVPAGTAGNALLLARDITQIQHLQTVRRELVANVSHELRTPLASIKLYVETLLDGGLEVPGMAEDRLNKIIREVDELTELVRELLELARLESGRDQPVLVPLDIEQIGRIATERLEAQAERAGIGLNVAFPAGLPPVRGDRRMLEGALVNLIHNAIKFTPSGGRVTVGASAESGGLVSLWVEDSGVGIPEEHLPRLFERFYKEDPARSGGGTGLGLAIVKHVALVHGGAVAVTSAVGVGSRFSIHLPISPAATTTLGVAHVA
jgi:two-component system, OmpR family, phosphate regulon sensor histidine kinase PhoR